MNRRSFAREFRNLSLLGAGLALTAGCIAGTGREGAAPDPRGTTWMLARLAGKPVAADATARPAYIVLQADGGVSANLGCNGAGGAYTLSGPHLGFGPLRSTRMACLKGMEVEHDLAAALGATAAYRVDNGRLILLDSANKPLAEFTPGAAP